MLRQCVGGRTAGEASPGVPHPKLLRVVESGVGAVRDRGVQEPAQRRPAVARAEGEQLRGGHGRPHPSLPVRAELLRGRGVPGDGGLRRQQHQHRALPLVATDQPHAVHGVVDPVQAAGEPPVQGEQRPAPRRPRPVEVGQVQGVPHGALPRGGRPSGEGVKFKIVNCVPLNFHAILPGGEHDARPGEHPQQPLIVESSGEVRSRRAAAGAEELADLVVGGLVLGPWWQ